MGTLKTEKREICEYDNYEMSPDIISRPEFIEKAKKAHERMLKRIEDQRHDRAKLD